MDGTSLLMTMSSCLSLGSNLELRWRKSALVFLDDTKSTGCQRAALWHHRYPTARLMHRSVRKIKEMNAGATSRALPMGNRFPLKAWQREGGNKQTKKKYPTPLWIFQKSAYESSWRVGEVSFFSFFNHSPLSSTLSDNRKKKSVQLFFVSSWQYLQQRQQYFILWKGIPSLFFFSFFDLQKTAIQHNTKKVKKPKGKTGHKTCKKPTTIAPNLPTTHSEYRLQQNCH